MATPVPLCTCVMKEGMHCLKAENGLGKQSRRWTLMFDVLPQDVTLDEAYARAAEAGLKRAKLQEDMRLNYRAIGSFFAACDPPADERGGAPGARWRPGRNC